MEPIVAAIRRARSGKLVPMNRPLTAPDLTGKHILLGVSGGIAAYKAPDLVRRLRERGAEVRVALTPAGAAFITPLTLQAVSGHPVHESLLSAEAESGMGHIELARWADLILIAPCTADYMARLVHGYADDLLLACCRASEAPLAIAPAMNRVMWTDAAVQRNRAQLERDGVHIIGPGSGSQACGEVGEGRMTEPLEIAHACAALFRSGALAGLSVLLTAGPTYEDLDPVRFIGNRSSGKMGYALAAAASEAGARVTLVSGPVALAAPERVERLQVRSAVEMHAAVMERLPGCDIFIGCAAVADYRPRERAAQKIKKTGGGLDIELVENPDILAEVARAQPRPFVVGFAAETEQVAARGADKRRAKGADLMAVNRVGEGLGMEVDDNALEVFGAGGSVALGPAPKTRLGRDLISLIAERYHAARRVPQAG